MAVASRLSVASYRVGKKILVDTQKAGLINSPMLGTRRGVVQQQSTTRRGSRFVHGLVLLCCLIFAVVLMGFSLRWEVQLKNQGGVPGHFDEARPLPLVRTDKKLMRKTKNKKMKKTTIGASNNAVVKLLQPNELKLPTPIIVMGMMKAGTTSIYGYFKCGLDPKMAKLSHYDCNHKKNTPQEKIGLACGKRIRRNLTKMKPRKSAFDTIDGFHLYAEIDGQEKNGGMTLPQWDYLDEVYDQFPMATWILNVRKPEMWLNSVDRWLDLRQRFIDNPYLPDLPRGVGVDDKDMIRFYLRQAERIREFCESHPGLSCVEVNIDQPDAGDIMENAFGIPETCWGNRNANANGTAIWSPM